MEMTHYLLLIIFLGIFFFILFVLVLFIFVSFVFRFLFALAENIDVGFHGNTSFDRRGDWKVDQVTGVCVRVIDIGEAWRARTGTFAVVAATAMAGIITVAAAALMTAATLVLTVVVGLLAFVAILWIAFAVVILAIPALLDLAAQDVGNDFNRNASIDWEVDRSIDKAGGVLVGVINVDLSVTAFALREQFLDVLVTLVATLDFMGTCDVCFHFNITIDLDRSGDWSIHQVRAVGVGIIDVGSVTTTGVATGHGRDNGHGSQKGCNGSSEYGAHYEITSGV